MEELRKTLVEMRSLADERSERYLDAAKRSKDPVAGAIYILCNEICELEKIMIASLAK